MMTLPDLIARLESAGEGSRELDVEIAVALGFGILPNSRHCMMPGEEEWSRIPQWTTSIDAALTLVPQEAFWSLQKWPGHYLAIIRKINATKADRYKGATPALAICIASLRAKGGEG